MTGRLLANAATLSLCLGSATPALAQDHRFAGFDGPRGANATVSLHVPLGGPRGAARTTVALRAGYGRSIGTPDADGLRAVRQLPVADFRFDRRGVRRARFAGFDLAELPHVPGLNHSDDQVDEMATKKGWLFYAIVGTLVAGLIGALVAIHDEDARNQDQPTTPTSPTGG